jgi:hypothetical protein
MRNQKDNNDVLAPAFTVSNWTEALTMDCNANADLATADTLGTLIKHLIELGIINGTVA